MGKMNHDYVIEKWWPSEWPPLNQYIIDNAFLATSERLKANPQWMPSRATNDSVGFDVRYIAPVENAGIVVYRHQSVRIDLGFKLDMPEEMGAELLIRSSLGYDYHLMLSNTIGLIDADYNDNVKLSIYNYGNQPYPIQDGERIAQIVFIPSAKGMAKLFGWGLKPVTTERQGGFGSTGNK